MHDSRASVGVARLGTTGLCYFHPLERKAETLKGGCLMFDPMRLFLPLAPGDGGIRNCSSGPALRGLSRRPLLLQAYPTMAQQPSRRRLLILVWPAGLGHEEVGACDGTCIAARDGCGPLFPLCLFSCFVRHGWLRIVHSCVSFLGGYMVSGAWARPRGTERRTDREMETVERGPETEHFIPRCARRYLDASRCIYISIYIYLYMYVFSRDQTAM